jgi:hypothetical protein
MPELMVLRTLSLGAQEFGYSTSSLLLWKIQNDQSWVNASKQRRMFEQGSLDYSGLSRLTNISL